MWPPTPIARSRRIIACIEQFARWYYTEHDKEFSLVSEPIALVPRTAEGLTRLLMWARLRQISMMQHLERAPTVYRRSTVNFGRPSGAGKEQQRIKHFPPEYAEDLLWKGHLRPDRETEPNIFYRYNTRDMMIALLDGWGGLRRSEGLHLWWSDIREDDSRPGHALVVLSHPEEGLSEYEDPFSGAIIKTRRKTTLHRLYGLRPRNVVKRGFYHVGWKGMALNTEHQSCVFWIDQQAAALFLVLYRGYMQFVRPTIMAKRRAMGGGDHPFLFVSESINKNTGLPGEPYSEKAYERNHEAAVGRIGLRHEKGQGTTTQGLRHLYGQTMFDLKVPPQVIRKGLHHTNILSHLIYTEPLPEKVNAVLRDAQKKIVGGHHSGIAPLTENTTAALKRIRNILDFGGSFD
jgi:integrase